MAETAFLSPSIDQEKVIRLRKAAIENCGAASMVDDLRHSENIGKVERGLRWPRKPRGVQMALVGVWMPAGKLSDTPGPTAPSRLSISGGLSAHSSRSRATKSTLIGDSDGGLEDWASIPSAWGMDGVFQ
jgi:hypothetical protein